MHTYTTTLAGGTEYGRDCDKPTRKECIARDISVFVMIASFSIHPLVYLLPH